MVNNFKIFSETRLIKNHSVCFIEYEVKQSTAESNASLPIREQ